MRADTERGPIAVKQYPRDGRDRLTVEFEALAFLARYAVPTVPRPLARDPAAGIALYEWIEGERIVTADAAAIDTALATLSHIHDLAPMARAGGWSRPASASILAPAQAIAQMHERRRRLDAAAPGSPELAAFLARFDEQSEELIAANRRRADEAGIAWEVSLRIERQTLSPSDFGFHNALRRCDGSLVFLDFEYFGWDDPAKLCSDFCLHPGMRLDEKLAARFRRGARAVYGDADSEFSSRLLVMRPLCGLCWCMIMLNDFLPSRRFDESLRDPYAKRATQLAKAGALLNSIAGGCGTNLDGGQ
jgi:hypothetical protein